MVDNDAQERLALYDAKIEAASAGHEYLRAAALAFKGDRPASDPLIADYYSVVNAILGSLGALVAARAHRNKIGEMVTNGASREAVQAWIGGEGRQKTYRLISETVVAASREWLPDKAAEMNFVASQMMDVAIRRRRADPDMERRVVELLGKPDSIDN